MTQGGTGTKKGGTLLKKTVILRSRREISAYLKPSSSAAGKRGLSAP